jgi:2-polyprenyl-6-methoxyphenol hydroxylase-like FAD-dependent oxidoreductase
MPHVLIRGDGVAGRCCARLLSRAGLTVAVEAASRPRLPAIMLGEPAQKLIADIFELRHPFENLPRIKRRIVAWGANANPAVVEHSAVVISEETLLERLGPVPAANGTVSAQWTVYAAKPLPAGAAERCFGSRIASAAPVELEGTAEPEACWMESLTDGWLFLIAVSPRAGWLLAAGDRPEELLRRSRVVGSKIAAAPSTAARFPAAPRMAAPIAGNDWLACGTAALAFDPICGDGAAHAVREGILASAVIQAAIRGGEAARLVTHYENRLTAGFLRHLVHCVEYYAAVRGEWWEKEAAAAKEGIEWCSRRLDGDPKFLYRLNGFELEAID